MSCMGSKKKLPEQATAPAVFFMFTVTVYIVREGFWGYRLLFSDYFIINAVFHNKQPHRQ